MSTKETGATVNVSAGTVEVDGPPEVVHVQHSERVHAGAVSQQEVHIPTVQEQVHEVVVPEVVHTEKIVEVPHVVKVPVEEIVEVPEIIHQERINHRPVKHVTHVPVPHT